MSSAANIIGRITVNGKDIYEIDDDPTLAPGIPAPIGSTAMRDNAGSGEEWLKTGAADNAWSRISDSRLAWLLAGNTLSGGSPSTPNEFMGSNNNFDVVFRRNAIELARLRSVTGTDALFQQVISPALNPAFMARRMLPIVTTVGAASAVVTYAPVPPGYSARHEIGIVAKRTDVPGTSEGYVRTLQETNVAGVLTKEFEQFDYTYNPQGTSVVITTAGANIVFTLTGVAGQNYSWQVVSDGQALIL